MRTKPEREAARKIEAKATPEPWVHNGPGPFAKTSAADDFDMEALRSKAEHYNNTSKQPADFNVRDVLAACDEIEKLQKRAEDWEQKDVASFEKTIADLREKLTETGAAHQSELAGAYTERNVAVDRAEKAERELESYAATDLTASLALVDVTRERDEARERLATAETLAEQRRVELKVHKQFTKQYNAAVERERDDLQRQLDEALILIEDTASSHLENDQLQSDLDAANAKVGKLRELVHQEECCEGAWEDSNVDHYGCCEALRCSLGETGGDDG